MPRHHALFITIVAIMTAATLPAQAAKDNKQNLLKMELAKAVAIGCGKNGDQLIASFHMPAPEPQGSLLNLCGGDHIKADGVIEFFMILAKNKGCSKVMYDKKVFKNDDAGVIDEEATQLVRRFSCG